jgi:CRISPR-associated endonuclease/helicase Cas3
MDNQPTLLPERKPMNRAEEKAMRLLQIEQLLWAHPEGLTRAEIARRLGVDRSVLTKYLAKGHLPPSIYEDDLDGNKLKLDRSADLTKASFSLHEVMAIHIATRLLATRFDKQNPHAASALRKLGRALQRLDRNVSQHLLDSADVMDEESAFRDPVYLEVLEKLTVAWAAGRKVKVSHQLPNGRVFNYILSPYFIEPYAIGQTAHVIGWREPPSALRTLKLERIRSADITHETYEIPKTFDAKTLLRDAWGIWYTEAEPQKVVLRFHPRVAPRIKESRWHVSQRLEEQADGYLMWSAQIAEPQEMLPWIRGWGADCEVVEPKELREALIGETRRMARVYGVAAANEDLSLTRLLRLWGKTKRNKPDPGVFHPALFHMLDVGNVARELLSERASPRWRYALANALNVEADTLANWLPYFVALHDIGKISGAFQSLNKEQLARLRHEGFTLDVMDIPHAHITQIYLERMLPQMFGETSSKMPQALSEALGGHHGKFAHPDDDIKTARRLLNTEPEEWKSLRGMADAILKNELLKREIKTLSDPANVSAAIMTLTGFAILCDWLGSDERYFRPAPNIGLAEYAKQSRDFAAQAAHNSGLLLAAQSNASAAVQSLFSDLMPLRPLQWAIEDIPNEILQSPTLTIIEAPTGEGKTEAALALAHRIARITGTDELYYALPTMATSNQMFGRLQAHLEKRLGLSTTVKLVHGQAYLIEADLLAETPVAAIQPLENGEVKPEAKANESVTWFNSSKRALLAPFGVGTIDQAELAALNVKHAALRMMGLVGKVVIVDEVHAYDMYMTTVLERLLRWLAIMNTSVILLSATLPKSRRKRLADAFGIKVALDDEKANLYPNLLVLSDKGVHQASPAVWQPHRTIALRKLHCSDEAAPEKAKWLLDAVTSGGCVCWITNTVRRAQRIFEELLKSAPPDVGLQLLHSQLPLEERQRREDSLKDKYGRTGNRPTKGIVVGTQVLEQSLDLDFDVMASDLAPMDLLLQRAGRLHRHERARPATHDIPRLWLNFEQTSDGDLKLGADRTIYAEFIMRQTLQLLKGRTHIELPQDYRALIEAVYADQPPSDDSPLCDAWDNLQAQQQRAVGEARQRLLPEPHPRDSFAKTAAMRVTFEEDENRADWFVAKTRLGERTLNIIPLERAGDFIVLDTDERLSVQAEAPRDAQRHLLRRHLRISHQGTINAIEKEAEQNETKLFTESPLLKGFYPLWLTKGTTAVKTERGTLKITLNPDLGLVIEKEGKANDTDE